MLQNGILEPNNTRDAHIELDARGDTLSLRNQSHCCDELNIIKEQIAMLCKRLPLGDLKYSLAKYSLPRPSLAANLALQRSRGIVAP